MTAKGKTVAEGRLERTVPIKFSICEGLDIGQDGGSPVDFSYEAPFAFTGKVEKVTVELKPEAAAAGDGKKAAQPERQKREKAGAGAPKGE